MVENLPNLLKERSDRYKKEVKSSEELLFCSDYDGTLVRFTEHPGKTTTSSEILSLFQELKDKEKVNLAILSGRSLERLKELVPLDGITLCGLHGMAMEDDKGKKQIWNGAEKAHNKLSRLKTLLADKYSERDELLIEDKEYAVGFHYRKFDGNIEELRQSFYETVEEELDEDLEVLEGDKVFEIRPRGWDKGDALRTLMNRSISEAMTVYIGDDKTDEDAFEVLKDEKNAYPVIVTEERTVDTDADYSLNGPEEVKKLLKFMTSIFE